MRMQVLKIKTTMTGPVKAMAMVVLSDLEMVQEKVHRLASRMVSTMASLLDQEMGSEKVVASDYSRCDLEDPNICLDSTHN